MPHKSPSIKKRDRLRMLQYILKKQEETFLREKIIFEQKVENVKEELQKKSSMITHLEQIISKLLQTKSNKSKPKLTISNVSNHDIPPSCISITYASQPYHSTPSQSAPVLGRGIPQLDGCEDPDVFRCPNCRKQLETTDDKKWHYETQIGRQDCSILRSMLGWNPS